MLQNVLISPFYTHLDNTYEIEENSQDLEEEKIDVAEEVGYRFWINAFETEPKASKITMKKFLRGYPNITVDPENESMDIKTKDGSSTIYSEFQRPNFGEDPDGEISKFLHHWLYNLCSV